MCDNGYGCDSNSECVSGDCVGGTCQACGNGVAEGDETCDWGTSFCGGNGNDPSGSTCSPVSVSCPGGYPSVSGKYRCNSGCSGYVYDTSNCGSCGDGTVQDPPEKCEGSSTTATGCTTGYHKICSGCQWSSCQLIVGCDDDADGLIDSSCGGTDCNDAQESIRTCSAPKPYCESVPTFPSPNCVQCRTSSDCASGYYCDSNKACVQKSCSSNPAGCDTDIPNSLRCTEGQTANCQAECYQTGAWPYGLKYDGSKCVQCVSDSDCPDLCGYSGSDAHGQSVYGLTVDFYCTSAKQCSWTVNKGEVGYYCDGGGDLSSAGDHFMSCCTTEGVEGAVSWGQCIDYDNNIGTGVPKGPSLSGNGYSCVDTRSHTNALYVVNQYGERSSSFMAKGKPYKYWVQIEDENGDFFNAGAGVWVGVQDTSGNWVVNGGPDSRKMSIANGQCTCISTWQGKCKVAQCTSTFSDTPTDSWPSPVKVVGFAFTG
ncbi:hypothetical protein HYU16_04475 [Candidatus Woesearchaeota archaeon]|nr:hypothetical protein [Candidatus Woesearchaeota archaeon]